MSLVAAGCLRSIGAETPLAEARATLEKWVETRQLISKTRTDWQSDKEMLEQTISVMERELKTVDEQMSKQGTNSVQVDKERTQAEAQLKAANDSLAGAKNFAADFEVKLRQFAPRLPAPLHDIIKPLLARMPADSTNTKMLPPERMQVIVGVLNEIDKFNNAVAIFSEKQKTQSGEEVAVEAVYVGLGAAYFVNDAGTFAGTGTAGPHGWDWTIQPEIASSVREVIQIYRSERPARFISLPAAIR
jgi:septal ring factor EnvC (AmiA/AmiB activator)